MNKSKKSGVALLAYISRTGADDFFSEHENSNMNEFVLWTYKIGNASKQMIRDQINSDGEVAFYVYVSESSGSGAVKVVAHFDDFEEAEGTDLYEGVPLEGMFRFTRYRWLDQPLQLNDFVNWNTGKTIEHPSWLRRHFLYVQDPFGKVSPATAGGKKKQHQMIREAAESIDGIVTTRFILDFVGEKYPDTNLSSIQTVIRAFTVNNRKRIAGFPENQKPRLYDRRYDILYQHVSGKGEYELYNPKKHGYWPIIHTGTSENEHGLEVKDAGGSLPKPEGESKVARKKSEIGEPPAFPEGTPERMEYDTIGSSIVRSPEVIDWVKTIEDSECQVCGYAIQSPDGSKSIDLHHIWPLGSPHHGYEKGYDRVDNAICLCPNHHREMHMGLFFIETETYKVIYHDEVNEFHNSILKRDEVHELGDLFLSYHRNEIFCK